LAKPENKATSAALTSKDAEAIRHFKGSIASGKHWYIALLEAVAMWDSPQETYNGTVYHYLINGEAFDWQLLAERLCETADGLLPEDEKNALLLHNRPPLDVSPEQFKDIIGDTRYRQHLNYHYGVTVERALVLAVKDEIRKERHVSGYLKDRDTTDEAFRRIYGETEAPLLERFRRERRHRRLKSMSLAELKEFTYWLFKYRLKHTDKEKVASDTRKALNWVNRHGLPLRLFAQPSVVIDL